MDKEKIKFIIKYTMMVITIISMIATFIGLFGGNYVPESNHTSVILCMVLPAIIVFDIILLIYWLIMKNVCAIIPAICLVFCWGYVGTIYQIRGRNEDTKANLTVATYNVQRFNKENDGKIATAIINKMKAEKADVICLQEYRNDATGLNTPGVEGLCSEDYPYTAMGRNDMIIFSKYQITDFDLVDFGETNNSALWADIKIGKKTIRVYSVHMQSTGINSSLKEMSKGMIGAGDANNYIAGNFYAGMQMRAAQSMKIASEVDQCETPVILCGDFNDVPYSYTYKTLLGNMEDGFKTCGSGFMHTYRGMKSLFRIDYIFHDKAIKGEYYYTRDWEYSDHNPVFFKCNI